MRVSLDELGLALDLSEMGAQVERDHGAALRAMVELEAGAIANPDEGRRVGHYWLRAPELAPGALGAEIHALWQQIDAFNVDFDTLLLVGVGGSALGPQLLIDALGARAAFIDNTDPVGVAATLRGLALERTLVLVISKSGGTKETRNGMLLTQAAFRAQGVDFASRAVAVTGVGSKLDVLASEQGWLARFPMWDWVGGRTSLHSAVGLLPMALLGLDWRGFVRGAQEMDARTRGPGDNPALLLAQAWMSAQQGRPRDMVMLPYCDRLLLLSRYLQQLVMESLGKTRSDGERVGLTVYGNKGSTDQHAYVQQLRDGPDSFFVSFVAVLSDQGAGALGELEVDPGVRAGDYLLGFLLGTRSALSAAGKRSLTLELERVDAPALGAVIALYERAVGYYATWLGVNAYNQPGVEAGKLAAAQMLSLQARLLAGESLPGVDAALIARRLAMTGRTLT